MGLSDKQRYIFPSFADDQWKCLYFAVNVLVNYSNIKYAPYFPLYQAQ